MITSEAIAVLNRLLEITSHSFPQYLMYSRPYVPPGDDQVWDTITRIVDDQSQLMARYYQLFDDNEIVADAGDFPMEYTDLHDLNIDYLLRLAVQYQHRDIQNIEACIRSLDAAPAAKSLSEETLGMAKGHLELLEEALEELTTA